MHRQLDPMDPDLVAAKDRTICFIDCKGSMTGGYRRRHAIEQAAVRAHLQFMAWADLPVYYVFDDLGVTTPYEVVTTGWDGPRLSQGSGAAYYLIDIGHDRPFDTVFGRAQQVTAARAA
jgi:hypothetical protein